MEKLVKYTEIVCKNMCPTLRTQFFYDCVCAQCGSRVISADPPMRAALEVIFCPFLPICWHFHFSRSFLDVSEICECCASWFSLFLDADSTGLRRDLKGAYYALFYLSSFSFSIISSWFLVLGCGFW